jgi:alkylation response protein AidB-like acyl-CoA dehydrogenase
LTEILVESAGELGATEGEQVWGDQTIDILAPFLDLRSVTISAGSSQVQRNVLAQRVLAL